jgi:hypothetical protein
MAVLVRHTTPKQTNDTAGNTDALIVPSQWQVNPALGATIVTLVGLFRNSGSSATSLTDNGTTPTPHAHTKVREAVGGNLSASIFITKLTQLPSPVGSWTQTLTMGPGSADYYTAIKGVELRGVGTTPLGTGANFSDSVADGLTVTTDNAVSGNLCEFIAIVTEHPTGSNPTFTPPLGWISLGSISDAQGVTASWAYRFVNSAASGVRSATWAMAPAATRSAGVIAVFPLTPTLGAVIGAFSKKRKSTMFLPQNRTPVFQFGPLTSAVDLSILPDAVIAQSEILVSKNKGSFAPVSTTGAATAQSNGYYSKTGSASDADTLGTLRVIVQRANYLPLEENYNIIPSDVYDALIGDAVRAGILGIAARGTLAGVSANTATISGLTLPANTQRGSVMCLLGDSAPSGQFREIVSHDTTAFTLTGGLDAPLGANPRFIIFGAAGNALAIGEAVMSALIEGNITLRQSQRIQNAALAGKVLGANTNQIVFPQPGGRPEPHHREHRCRRQSLADHSGHLSDGRVFSCQLFQHLAEHRQQ